MSRHSIFALVALFVVGSACDRVKETVGLDDDVAKAPVVEEPSEDAKALAIAVGSMVPTSTNATPPVEVAPPAATPSVPAPSVVHAGLDELELWDVQVEWRPSPEGYRYYYGSGSAPNALMLSAKGRLRKSVATGAEITVKATCDDGPEMATDADVARIDGAPAGVLPISGTEFKVESSLFVRNIVSSASKCRVVVALRDAKKDPIVRGSLSLCWAEGSKTPTPCAAPVVESKPEWTLDDLQFLPTNEVGFTIVAGTEKAPDRLGIRSTCHVGDRHFVEFQYVDARLDPLEPGDVSRHHHQVQSAWEYMRYADCDVEIQGIRYDKAADKLLGITEIGRRCMRPSGAREGRCGAATAEIMMPDPSGNPVAANIQSASFSSYNGWYGGYAQAELTLRSPLTKDARFEFVAKCGKKVERMPITFPTPLDMVHPGQSLRVQGSVSGRGRPKPSSCTTEFILQAKDEVGLDKEWQLAKQCYSSSGMSVPCKGAPTTPATGGLGLSGIGGLIR
jgi:hypothetical protein